MQVRLSCIELISYPDSSNIEDLHDYLRNTAFAFCSILHDKDEGKKPHYHTLVFKNPTLKKRVFINATTLDELMTYVARWDKVHSLPDALRYLTHSNAPEKYQYPESDVYSYPYEYSFFLNRLVAHDPDGELLEATQFLLASEYLYFSDFVRDITAERPYLLKLVSDKSRYFIELCKSNAFALRS